jgi:pimeloyl-ACP methyl ester carboxylesterase
VPYVEPAGGRIWYEVSGERGPWVVLTGGWGLAHHQFARVTPHLAREARVVNWNWRGVGNSDRALPGAHSIDRWEADLELVLDELGVDSAYLWGTSSGTLVSLRLAARRPELVAGAAIWMLVKADPAFRRAFLLLPEIFDSFGFDGFAQLLCWLGLGSERLLSPEGIEFARWERQALEDVLDPAAIGPICHAVAWADGSWDLANARCPVTILAGTDGPLGLDGDWGKGAVAEVQALQPRARVTAVPGGGGTYFVVEKPEESAAAFLAWAHFVAATG